MGEIRKAREVGILSYGHGRCRLIWHSCTICGKERWVRLVNGKPSTSVCRNCNIQKLRLRSAENRAERNPSWKGGRYRRFDGYVLVRLQPGDFFYPMVKANGYVLEHRLVMARHLGRCLYDREKVHHKDGIRYHNELNNLMLSTASKHLKMHSKGYRDGYQQGLIDGRTKQITELKQEIRLLRWEIKQIRERELL